MNISFNKNLKYIFLTSFIIFIDQIFKYLIKTNYYKLINKKFLFFSIDYITNDGAAFSILSGNRVLLSTISLFTSIILIIFILNNKVNTINKYSFCFILAGSIGNGIDRIINGYVIDFIRIRLIQFPIFNIADISINIGAFILLYNYLINKRSK